MGRCFDLGEWKEWGTGKSNIFASTIYLKMDPIMNYAIICQTCGSAYMYMVQAPKLSFMGSRLLISMICPTLYMLRKSNPDVVKTYMDQT